MTRRRGATPVNGRQRLIDAALRLAAASGGVHAIGMRELAREAGLNPNTFYRHFADFDDLGVAAVSSILPQLRDGLRAIRAQKRPVADEIARTVQYFFEFVDGHADAVQLAARELQGPSTRVREALRAGVQQLAGDIVEDAAANRRAGAPGLVALRDLADAMIRHLLTLAVDWVEYPPRRAAIERQGERFVLTLVAGAHALRLRRFD